MKKKRSYNTRNHESKQTNKIKPIKPMLTPSQLDSLQPLKTASAYKREYKMFLNWAIDNNYLICEETLIYYTDYLQNIQNMAPNTIRSKISMVKKELLINGKRLESCDVLDLKIKRINTGYVPTKAEIFSQDQIELFLREAPNEEYIMMKFILLVGFYCCARIDDLTYLKWSELSKTRSGIKIQISGNKNYTNRENIAPNDVDDPFILEYLYDRIYELRKISRIKIDRAFLKYDNGKLTNNPIGRNTLSEVPMKIAEFLGLDNCHDYSGHSIRRTSASVGAENGMSVSHLRELGGWKSENAALGYIQTSSNYKKKTRRYVVE